MDTDGHRSAVVSAKMPAFLYDFQLLYFGDRIFGPIFIHKDYRRDLTVDPHNLQPPSIEPGATPQEI